MFSFGTCIRYPQASRTLWANFFLAFLKGADLIAFHHCIYETFRVIDVHLKVPLGHSHPVLGALKLSMPTICNLTTTVHT
jgi:hypothetical protein